MSLSDGTSTVLAAEAEQASRLSGRRRRLRSGGRLTGRQRQRWLGWLFALPALAFYAFFDLRPILTSIQYSFYNWDGIGASTSAGFSNYTNVFTTPDLRSSILHAFFLIIFFTIFPLTFGLVAASVMRSIEGKFTGALARTVLFLPQIIPGAAAGVAWIWMYSDNGVVNELLRAIGLGGIARAWLGDFTWALVAVGFIGTWLQTGFCTLLLMSGIGKIDAGLYEAARLDGAGPIAQFRAITLPGLRQEIGVAVTVTIISALASFDVVYLATQGGPGTQTLVPGVAVYDLAFNDNRIGAASAFAIVLAILVILVIVPLQQLFKER
jgi:raffinose/stachyose/melibiose transport system permease protein